MYTINDLTLHAMAIIHKGLTSKDEYVRLDTAVKLLQTIQIMEYNKLPAHYPTSVTKSKGKKKDK